MIKKIYCVFDNKTKTALDPVMLLNDEAAKRAYGALVYDLFKAPAGVDKSLYYYRSDFQLYCLGDFDTDTLDLEVLTKPRLIDNFYNLLNDFVKVTGEFDPEEPAVEDLNVVEEVKNFKDVLADDEVTKEEVKAAADKTKLVFKKKIKED